MALDCTPMFVATSTRLGSERDFAYLVIKSVRESVLLSIVCTDAIVAGTWLYVKGYLKTTSHAKLLCIGFKTPLLREGFNGEYLERQ